MKTIKSRAEFQINKLVEEIGAANVASSEQQRSYLTSRAIYRADRIASLLRRASITAVVVFLMVSMVSCAWPTRKAESTNDSTITASDTVSVDTVGHEEVK
jgi:hypothetical protein